jgi:hypothetical protein
MYAKAKGDGPGWVCGTDDVTRAITAYRAGTLAGEEFVSITNDGRRYTIAGIMRLGLVPHRDELVARFCLDLDYHSGDYGNVHLADALARLRGICLVTASETGDGNHLDEALGKDITGGDRVVARYMRGKWYEFTPHFKIFLSTNYRPRISGTDDAIWERM